MAPVLVASEMIIEMYNSIITTLNSASVVHQYLKLCLELMLKQHV